MSLYKLTSYQFLLLTDELSIRLIEGAENARTDWLWKADQAETADTLPYVNLRMMTAADSASKTPKKANQMQWTGIELILQLRRLPS